MVDKKKIIIIGSIVLVVVFGGVAWYIARSNLMMNNNESMSSSYVNMNSDMYKQYSSLRGDEYDKAYLAGMIVHHQGAIDMATLAVDKSLRPEIVTLARGIIDTQSNEVTKMQSWQTKWSYPSNSSSSGHDMNAMNMSMSMEADLATLKTKTGDAFDKAFLEQMIAHHQAAIDMSGSAASNANHQEIKNLARNIISAQTAEITTMKKWLKEWNL
jgi:uncharacterized protein (DUF305 family)